MKRVKTYQFPRTIRIPNILALHLLRHLHIRRWLRDLEPYLWCQARRLLNLLECSLRLPLPFSSRPHSLDGCHRLFFYHLHLGLSVVLRNKGNPQLLCPWRVPKRLPSWTEYFTHERVALSEMSLDHQIRKADSDFILQVVQLVLQSFSEIQDRQRNSTRIVTHLDAGVFHPPILDRFLLFSLVALGNCQSARLQ